MVPNIGAIVLVVLSSWTHILPSSKATSSDSDSINGKAAVIFLASRCCRTEIFHDKSRRHCNCGPALDGNVSEKKTERLFQFESLRPPESILLNRLISKKYRKFNHSVVSSKDGGYYIDKSTNVRQPSISSTKSANSTLDLIVKRLSSHLLAKSINKTLPLPKPIIWKNGDDFKSNKFHLIQNLLTNSIQKASLVNKRNWNRSYSRNVFVFGRDDRTKIPSSLLRKFPYSNIVRLSTGCTGTLITPLHVLTAAHCVHNGREFLYKLEMMKVEVPDPIGARDYYIEKIGIPDRWLNPRSRNYQQASFDYAVVRLSYGVHGLYQFLPLSVPTESTLHQNLQFLGFPNYGFGLWHSVCPARTTKPFMDGNLILARCDSAIGNSGAAIFTTDFRSEKKVVGVLSSTVSMGSNPSHQRYSVITALTETKLLDICTELGPIGLFYGVCPSPERFVLRRQGFQRKIKTIPFFG